VISGPFNRGKTREDLVAVAGCERGFPLLGSLA
jgi:hypothetical protein